MDRSRFILLVSLTAPVWSPVASAQEDTEIILGKRSEISAPADESETIELATGSRLRRHPRSDAEILEILAVPLSLPVIDTRPGWVKVAYGNWHAWVATGMDRDSAGETEPAEIEPGIERLNLARQIMGPGGQIGRLGPFSLYSDVDDAELLGWLSAVAYEIVEAYLDRFGLDPGNRFAEVVVLFADEASYRHFQGVESRRLAGTHSQGYAYHGLAVLPIGDRDRQAVASVLVHELTHLLNRRLFRFDLPPWLDEGLAEDLAYCEIDANGALRLGSLGGRLVTGPSGDWTLSGAPAHLALLLSSWDTPARPPLALLTTTDRIEFIEPDSRSLLYAESAFLVRLLLDASGSKMRDRFRHYLELVRANELLGSVDLWTVLEVVPEELEPRLFRFANSQAVAAGISVERTHRR